ncbi:MAG: response regulator transcription factor [Desulfobacterales bacterium]|jgi:two-component system response regulator RegX3|nr:response regulator transcription factor [Desulfobacterales bacterium]MDD3081251.1 response regulator transcription factor [Desulfobacterales bacterium]MDD3949958.1 response regulator transcription factor [Desulfobacterales bacterium]MDD4464403.1 response regulator transcription factor [Desulfobacterales bacterium]MDY0377900.1 response regulator transcription factor [Desulfobacterales bacterium]
MKTSKARILIVEDDPPILQGLCDVLVFNGYEAFGVPDGVEGLEAASNQTWDLILLDVMLPGLDGFSICRKLREKKPSQAVVMLTARGSEDDVVAGFKAGADDYISKPFSLRELMVRVEAVLRRTGKIMSNETVEFREVCFDGRNLTAGFQGRTCELTRREMDIVSYLHRHQDRIVSKKELLTHVWHYADADIETRTVDIHMLKLRKKIASIAPDLPFVQTIRGEGYRLETTS